MRMLAKQDDLQNFAHPAGPSSRREFESWRACGPLFDSIMPRQSWSRLDRTRVHQVMFAILRLDRSGTRGILNTMA